jgi:hypothetical protein
LRGRLVDSAVQPSAGRGQAGVQQRVPGSAWSARHAMPCGTWRAAT